MGRKLASIISATGMSVSLAVLAVCLNFEMENSVILLVALFTFIVSLIGWVVRKILTYDHLVWRE